MAELIRRLTRLLLLTVLALAGLAMAVIFTVSTLIALGIAMLVASLRGQRQTASQRYFHLRSQHSISVDVSCMVPFIVITRVFC